MIPPQFDYIRATTIDAAVTTLTSLGDEARVLAGGQSLIPFMRLRFAAPEALVDISELRGLSYARVDGDRLRVGALTRHVDLEHDPVVATQLPLLATMAGRIGDTQVRNRGTIGGAVAHADPAGEYGALCLMLEAELVTTRRTIRAEDFFLGLYTTPLDHDELLVELSFPVQQRGSAYLKFGRALFDWAIVGVAVQLVEGGARIGLVSMGDTPVRARAAEEVIAAGGSVQDAASRAADGLSPTGSLRASVDYKLHLARVLTARALDQANAS